MGTQEQSYKAYEQFERALRLGTPVALATKRKPLYNREYGVFGRDGPVSSGVAMHYLRPEDKDLLEEKLREFTKLRKTLSDRIGRARELGDLRENAEYHTAKEDQGHNERKIRDIEQKLASAVIVGDDELPEGMVFVGATVRLRDVKSGEEELYSLVGELTDDRDDDHIQVTPNSPMGMALMKSRVGETVRVDLPRGPRKYEIVEIQ